MIERTNYLQQIIPFIDNELIKVIVGIRRSGKSVLLRQIAEHIKKQGVKDHQIIALDFEDFELSEYRDLKKFNDFLKSKIESNDRKTYIFIDEIQEVQGFERVINSIRAKYNVDIYISGSNADLLSGELASLLSGRYVEFKIYPFTFREFSLSRINTDTKELFQQYIVQGGMPLVVDETNLEVRHRILLDMFNSVVLKDIIKRNKIGDPDLLERIIHFIFANTSRTFSANSIAKYLKSQRVDTKPETVNNYLRACVNACLFEPIKRNDLNGKGVLKTNEKYFVADHGLRNALFGHNIRDIELILENIVCIDLLSRGYKLTVGKYDNYEVDFVAEKNSERLYFQVCYKMDDPETRARELRPLKLIKDNFPKIVLTMDEQTENEEGIQHLNIVDFLRG